MTVVGIYDLGMPDIEKRTRLHVAGRSAGPVRPERAGHRGGDHAETARPGSGGDQQRCNPALPGYEIDSWQTNFPELQAALDTKGGVMNIFSVIILVIAGIGILNLLLMAVYERTREIGVLGALGMKPRQISLLFILEGAMMGLVGVAFGVVLGLLINGLLGQVGIDYSQFSSLTEYTALISGRVYPTLGLEKLLQRALTVLIIAVLAAFYPAREAAQSEPAEALHYV